MGWIGKKRELLYALDTFGVDLDQHGRPVIHGGHISSFMGDGKEVVISDDVMCEISGKRVQLAGLMAETSYGVSGIKVF